MTAVSMGDNGLMAAVFAPLDEVQAVLDEINDYVVIANLNSTTQAVIGGSTSGVQAAMARLSARGHQVIQLPVSHAFHTEIVAPAAEPLKAVLGRLHLESPTIPLVGNVTGDFYPRGPNVAPQMIDLLGRQIASPVQFVTGLRTLYDAGCRCSSRSARSGRCMAWSRTSSAATPRSRPCSPTTRSRETSCPSTRRSPGCTRPGSVGPRHRPAAPAAAAPVPAAGARPAGRCRPGRRRAARRAGADDVYTRLGHVFADALAEGTRLLQGNPPPRPPPSTVPAASRW